ncbi:MAG TPA: enoyl-CoA hydratase/isomerase family protein [Rubrivivax sp.]|nr:enoyl-CoA hydratase/isomerase family protein [Rubrivivax sp.]
MTAEPALPRFESLKLHVDGALAQLTLNRPERLNALSPALMRELSEASRWLAALPELRVLLLAGAGRAFSAGFDLDAMRAAQADLDPDTADLGRQVVEAFEAIPAITLAAVRGPCVGGGLLLAGICDLRIAAGDARFSIPEMEIGIPLAWGGVPRLIRLVGPAVAMELVLDCNTFDAAQALAWRFVNRVVPAAELDQRALAWAQRLAQRPLQALRSSKRRFAAAAESLCSAAGSEVDAAALLDAFRDPETQAMQQRWIAAHRG